jgi:hypothetical protein
VSDSPFVSDPGPGWDPEAAAAAADAVRAEHEEEERAGGTEAFGFPEVEEERVRQVLFVGGDSIHAAVGVGEYDWVMTQRDLDRIAPPLTRILNRYELTKAVAGYSDELALLMGFGLYSWRSVLELAAVRRAGERPRPADVRAEQAPPAPAPREAPPPPAWPAAAPPPPQSSPASSPAPPSATGAGGDTFPGAGTPREPSFDIANVEVAPGYVTRAEQIRQARERRPNAVPAEAPSPPQ